MKIGVMSDTHGNSRMMHNVAEKMTSELGVGTIIHLGDDYSDASELVFMGYDVHRVPGLWCEEYLNPGIPKKVIEEFGGVSVAYAHAAKDLGAREFSAAIVLTGHTHAANLDVIGPCMFLNPGHLASRESRNQRASFAILDIQKERVQATIHELNGSVREELAVERSELA